MPSAGSDIRRPTSQPEPEPKRTEESDESQEEVEEPPVDVGIEHDRQAKVFDSASPFGYATHRRTSATRVEGRHTLASSSRSAANGDTCAPTRSAMIPCAARFGGSDGLNRRSVAASPEGSVVYRASSEAL